MRQPPLDGQYRNASELNTFRFCERAWMFERQGAPSAREPERTAGTIYHQKHGERVEAAGRSGGAARVFLLVALVLILLALAVGLR